MKLSTNFSDSEFFCKDGCGFGTYPGDIDMGLVALWQYVRSTLGVRIDLSSGCRCAVHNASIPDASPTSDHLYGRGADGHGPKCKKVVEMLYADETPTPEDWLMARDELSLIEAAAEAWSSQAGIEIAIGVYYTDLFAHLGVRGKRARWAR